MSLRPEPWKLTSRLGWEHSLGLSGQNNRTPYARNPISCEERQTPLPDTRLPCPEGHLSSPATLFSSAKN